MPAPGRLALLLLLAAACFRDPAPPELSATSSETGDASSSTGSTSTTGTTDITSTSSISGTSEASATTCAPTAWYLDADQDGHGDPDSMQLACSQPTAHVEVGDDCDDNDEARAPGLLEVCDNKDNDCDPLVDEYSAMNTSCNDCVLTANETSSYAHCQFQRTYKDARVECQKRGGDLVVIQDQLENTTLTKQSLALKGDASKWYMGLDDLAAEGTFVWVDGSPVGFDSWGPLEPNNTGGAEDCAVLYAGDGSWNDQQCALASEFICEGANGP